METNTNKINKKKHLTHCWKVFLDTDDERWHRQLYLGWKL